MPSKTKEEITIIRRIIKKRCPTISVRMGTGTAYGWVDILANGKNLGRPFTESEKRCLKSLGLQPGSNADVISPENRLKFIEKHLYKRVVRR